MAKRLVIYGNGQFARMLCQLVSEDGLFDVAAFTADGEFITERTIFDRPAVPFEAVERDYPPTDFDMMTAVGVTRIRDRQRMHERAKAKGYRLPNYVGRRAITHKDLVLGENNWIADGVSLGLGGRLGDGNIITANCHVGHDFRIGNHNYIAPGCTIGGTCRIGSLCYLGIGSTTINRITIGDEVLVGAGSLIVREAQPCCRYFGVPARKTGEHAETGIVFTHDAV